MERTQHAEIEGQAAKAHARLERFLNDRPKRLAPDGYGPEQE